MLKVLEKLIARLNEVATELDNYHVSEEDVEYIGEYGECLDALDDACAELQDAESRLMERLEILQEKIENIDEEDLEDDDYEDD